MSDFPPITLDEILAFNRERRNPCPLCADPALNQPVVQAFDKEGLSLRVLTEFLNERGITISRQRLTDHLYGVHQWQ